MCIYQVAPVFTLLLMTVVNITDGQDYGVYRPNQSVFTYKNNT